MAASLAQRVTQAVSSWRHTDSVRASANPADVESVTSLIAVPHAEELWRCARARKR
jgi:hypothetical protein